MSSFHPTPPTVPQPGPQPGLQPQKSGLALAALILGIAGIFVPLCGIAGLVCGIVAVVTLPRQAPRRGMALAGIICGGIGMITSAVLMMALILLPALNRARSMAQRSQCMSHMRQVSIGITMYATSYRSWTPPDLNTLVTEHMLVTPANRPSVLSCPLPGSMPYVYTLPNTRITTIRRPASTIMLYEPPSNHEKGMNALFCDGHVEWIPLPLADQVIADLKADRNPPPSLGRQ